MYITVNHRQTRTVRYTFISLYLWKSMSANQHRRRFIYTLHWGNPYTLMNYAILTTSFLQYHKIPADIIHFLKKARNH